jgi:hypothetical protein
MIWWHWAALLIVFALLLWAFAVFLWDPLKERTRGWLRVMLMVVLAPACALTTLVVSAVAGMALSMAFEPNEAPSRSVRAAGAHRARRARDDLRRDNPPRDDYQPDGVPVRRAVFLGLFFSHAIALGLFLGRAVSLGLTFTLVRA